MRHAYVVFSMVVVLGSGVLSACEKNATASTPQTPSQPRSTIVSGTSGYTHDVAYVDSFRVEFASGHFAQFKDIYSTNGVSLFNHSGDGLILENPTGNHRARFNLGGADVGTFYNQGATQRGLDVSGRVTAPSMDVDTIYAGTALIIKFADGNEIQFVTTGTNGGVLVAGKVGTKVSNMGFDHGGGVSFGATAFTPVVDSMSFYGGGARPKPVITGSRGGNAALNQLLIQLAALGLVTNSTTN